MWGLIKKDLYVLKGYIGTLLLFLLCFSALAIQTPSMLFIGLMVLPYMAMTVTFSYDQNANFNSYALTLPITRREIVKEKYMLLIGALFLMFLLTVLLTGIVTYFQTGNVHIMKIASIPFGTFLAMLSISLFQYPIIYKIGLEKGRIYTIIIAAIIAAIAGILGTQIGNTGMNSELILLFQKYGLWAIACIILVGYYISYRMSVRILQKKDM